MKKIILLIIAAAAFSLSANAQIVSSHYYDNYGSPYFRVDFMKSSQSYYGGEDAEMSFFPTDDGYHGLGLNASVGYYVPIWKTNFFYAPEIGLTLRHGNSKTADDDNYYDTYSGFGLRAVPLQFGYSFEISNSFSINPRIGTAICMIPFGTVSSRGGESTYNREWKNEFDTISSAIVIGCDLVMRNSNIILSFIAESGSFSQAGISLGMLF